MFLGKYYMKIHYFYKYKHYPHACHDMNTWELILMTKFGINSLVEQKSICTQKELVLLKFAYTCSHTAAF